jgi:hypothetical protein
MSVAGGPDGLNDVYEALDRYNWDDDVEFQSGLSAILGSNSTPEQAAELTLRARCFYYARYALLYRYQSLQLVLLQCPSMARQRLLKLESTRISSESGGKHWIHTRSCSKMRLISNSLQKVHHQHRLRRLQSLPHLPQPTSPVPNTNTQWHTTTSPHSAPRVRQRHCRWHNARSIHKPKRTTRSIPHVFRTHRRASDNRSTDPRHQGYTRHCVEGPRFCGSAV